MAGFIVQRNELEPAQRGIGRQVRARRQTLIRRHEQPQCQFDARAPFGDVVLHVSKQPVETEVRLEGQAQQQAAGFERVQPG